MSAQVLWYSARAGGIVAWSLAAASVIWGLALSTRVLRGSPRPAWLFDLHRFLGGLALVFTVVHVASVLADTYVHFSLMNVIVPFTGTWHPLAVAWGVLAFYALLAVELTSLARAHIPKTIWRRVHFLSFGLYALTTIHALTAGSDRRADPFVLAVAAVTATIAVLTAIRVLQAGGLRRPQQVRSRRLRTEGPVPVAARR
jgi:DMSO/TMAO reductase YedYZ heme-binding membrane subunit